MSIISQDAPGKTVLLMGNEAIARGALEAGIKICAAYPGNPSSEITGSLSGVADEFGLHVEWSVNEKVALEVAAAASFAGLRGLCTMKQPEKNGQNDFMSHHVTEKTEGEGQNSGHMANNFNDENQRTHPPYRPHKMFDVFYAVVLDSDDMGKDHHHQGTA